MNEFIKEIELKNNTKRNATVIANTTCTSLTW